jgi:hypothetical protein
MTTQPPTARPNPCLPARALVGLLLEQLEKRWDGTLFVLDEREQFVAAIRFRDGVPSAGRFRDPAVSLHAGMLPLCGHVTGTLMPVAAIDLVGDGPDIVSGVVVPQSLIVTASRSIVPAQTVERVIETIGTDWLRISAAVDLADWCFDATERRVIDCLQRGPCDLPQLAARTELRAPLLERIVYALWITRAVTPVPAWRPLMSGITEKNTPGRDRFDSIPTRLIEFDRTAERVVPESLRPIDRARSVSARPSARAPTRPNSEQLESADTHMIVAERLLERGDPKAAVLQAQKALHFGPMRPDHEALYAWLLYQRAGGGAYVPSCAWEHLASALERDRDCERAHYYQGLLLKRCGDFVLARQHLARAVALNPNNADAHGELVQLDQRGVGWGGQRSLTPRAKAR